MDNLSIEWAIEHAKAGDAFINQAMHLFHNGIDDAHTDAIAAATIAQAHYTAATLPADLLDVAKTHRMLAP